MAAHFSNKSRRKRQMYLIKYIKITFYVIQNTYCSQSSSTSILKDTLGNLQLKFELEHE